MSSTSWMREARCVGLDGFLVDDGAYMNARAKLVCRACPVIAECLDYALAERLDGIWGGTSGRQRRRLTRVAVT